MEAVKTWVACDLCCCWYHTECVTETEKGPEDLKEKLKNRNFQFHCQTCVGRREKKTPKRVGKTKYKKVGNLVREHVKSLRSKRRKAKKVINFNYIFSQNYQALGNLLHKCKWQLLMP